MKGTFQKNIYTMKLDETLKEHQPYAALVVSTTGLDNKDFSDHSPTRVVLKQFEYDNELKAYKESFAFDKMVKASDEAVKKALENNDYDVFANGGIDKNAYQMGEGVLTQKDFKAEFDRVLEAIKSDKTLLIVNNLEHAIKYLDKINCAEELKAMSSGHTAIDQVSLTKEYLKTGKGSSLEDLRNSMLPHPTLSFAEKDDLVTDFKAMSKEDFLKAHTDITSKAYDVTSKDIAKREEKIIGGPARIDVINAYITKHGTEQKIFESNYMRYLRESEAARAEEFSQSGKERYQQGSVKEKFDTLIETGVIDPTKILDNDSEFQRLINTIEDSSNKGITIIHAASTGFEFQKPLPQKTGQPIQFTALTYTRNENGEIDFTARPLGLNITIQAPSRSILLAEKNITDPKRPYDTFKETGIDLAEYKQGKGVISQDDAIKKIENYFSRLSPKDYPIVAIGGTNGSDKSFTQVCMSNLAHFEMCDAPFVDFTQAVKDYAYLTANSDIYPENIMFSEDKMAGKKFGIQDIASARGEEPLNSTLKKVAFVSDMIKLLEQQHKELFRQDPENTVNRPLDEAKDTTGHPRVTNDKSDAVETRPSDYAVVKTAEELKSKEESEEDLFADENDDYDNVVTAAEIVKDEENTIEQTDEQTEKRFLNDVFAAMIEDDEQSAPPQDPPTVPPLRHGVDRNTPIHRRPERDARPEASSLRNSVKVRDGDRYMKTAEDTTASKTQEASQYRGNAPTDRTSRFSDDKTSVGTVSRRRAVLENAHQSESANPPTHTAASSETSVLLEQAMKVISQQNETISKQAEAISQQGEQIKHLVEQIVNSNTQTQTMMMQMQSMTSQYMDFTQKTMQQMNELREENFELMQAQNKGKSPVTTRVS